MIRSWRTLRYIWRHPLNAERRIGALSRWVRFQFARRLAPGPILVPLAGSARVLVEGGDHVSLVVYAGPFDFEEMLWTAHLLRPGDLFVDVGANVGVYSLLASVVAGARTLAFEPVPDTRRRLLEHVRLHDAQDRVEVRSSAVGDRPGRVHIQCDYGAANRLLRTGEPMSGDTVEVDMVRLDDVVDDPPPVLLKVDVEGYEEAVLEGAEELLEAPALLGLVVELTGHGRRFGVDESAVRDRLRDRGFRQVRYDPTRRSLSLGPRSHLPETGNVLYARTTALDELRERLAAAPDIWIPHARTRV